MNVAASERRVLEPVESPTAPRAICTPCRSKFSRVVQVDVKIAFALLAVTLLLYARSFGYPFITFDDPMYIVNNAHLQQGLSLAGLRWGMTTLYFSNWHPLVWLVYLANASFFHSRPESLHVFNAVVHAMNASLLFAALRQMTGQRWRAAMAAGLFAWHPLRIESVVWISETKDVLAGLFWMLTMMTYQRYAERPSISRYSAVALTFALALMSKPTAVTLPAILLLIDGWPLRRVETFEKFLRCGFEKLPLLAMAAGASMLYFRAQRQGGALISPTDIHFSLRLENAIISVAAYLRDTCWPAKICIMYPHPFFISRPIPLYQVWIVAVGLLAMTAFAILLWRARPYLLVGWLWFLIALLPASGILAQAGIQARADRYTYLPSVGLALLIAWSAGELLAAAIRSASIRRRIAITFTGLLCSAMWVATTVQIGYWRNTQSLFARADAVTELNYFAKSVLAMEATRQGRIGTAVSYGRSAVEICGGSEMPHAALGAALLQANQPREAFHELMEAARRDPYNGRVRDDLGTALVDLDRPAAAVEQFKLGVQFNPGFPEGHSNWATLLASQGDYDQAIEQWRAAIALDPSFGAAQGLLATALEQRGDRRGAITHYRAALADGERRPTWLTDFAWLLATDPISTPAEVTEAVAAGQESVDRSPTPLALDALAAAEARDGQFDRAVAHAGTALRLLGNQQPQLLAGVSARLRLYQTGRFYVNAS